MRKNIKAEFPDTWPENFVDRSKLPSIFWSYYWHRLWTDKTIGSRDGVDAMEKAVDMVKEFDENCKKEFPLPDGECHARIAQNDQGQTVVAQFHLRGGSIRSYPSQLNSSSDATNLDRNDTKLFHLICPSMIGGLPVAEILTTWEDTDTIMFGLELLKSVLPAGAFYGRGRDTGPQLFMTDDADSLKNDLRGT